MSQSDSAHPLGAAPCTDRVRLSLLRGIAHRRELILEDHPAGVLVSVGSSARCDWTIRTLGLRDHALSFMLISGILFVRREAPPAVLLNGERVGTTWLRIPQAARIEAGGAHIAVQLPGSIAESADAAPSSPAAIHPSTPDDDSAHASARISSSGVIRVADVVITQTASDPAEPNADSRALNTDWLCPDAYGHLDAAGEAAVLSEPVTRPSASKWLGALLLAGLFAGAYKVFCLLLDRL